MNIRNSILARPILEIGKPEIDSIVFYYDSTYIFELLEYENRVIPEKTFHLIEPPEVTIFYRVKVYCKNYILYRYAETAVDSFTTGDFIRDKLFESSTQYTEAENPFNWLKLVPGDSNQIAFVQNINFPVGNTLSAKFSLHICLLYQSEYNILFDSYFNAKYQFTYPANLLVLSRAPFRSIKKGYFRIKGNVDEVKLYYVADKDTKIYSYDEALSIYDKVNYYMKKIDREKALLNKRY